MADSLFVMIADEVAMTTNMIRPLLVAFALLLFPASASAECAWVLWMREGATRPAGTPEWNLSTAVETLDQCRAEKAKAIADFSQLYAGRSRFTDNSVAFGGKDKQGEDWARLITFNCFPDTVDPRGPRGGYR